MNRIVNEYYLMDTYYRKFYVAYDKESNHELLKKLKTLVEGLYTNWFMGELSAHWSQAVKTEMTENGHFLVFEINKIFIHRLLPRMFEMVSEFL